MEISSILLTFNWIDHAEPITCPTGNYKSLCFAFTFANFQLPVATCLLPVACFLLPVFCCQLPLVGWLTDCFVLSCGSCFAPCYQISNTIQFAMLPHLLNSPFSFCLLGFLLLACLLELLVLLIRICNQFLGDAYICFHFLWRSRNQPERLAGRQAGSQSGKQGHPFKYYREPVSESESESPRATFDFPIESNNQLSCLLLSFLPCCLQILLATFLSNWQNGKARTKNGKGNDCRQYNAATKEYKSVKMSRKFQMSDKFAKVSSSLSFLCGEKIDCKNQNVYTHLYICLYIHLIKDLFEKWNSINFKFIK